jgi:uncharacterized RDD family membrane protein YckC
VTQPGAGWWPDPTGRRQYRYWDGNAWTEHVADNGVGGFDPLDPPDPPAAAAVPAVAVPSLPIEQPIPRRERPTIQPLTLEELAARRVIGAPDPDPTEVMPRRVVAFLIDAAVCVAVGVLLIMAIAPVYTTEEYNRLYSCDPSSNGFVDSTSCTTPTFVEIGDRNYDVTSDGLVTFELFGAFALFTFVYWAVAEWLIGATVGKWFLGLRVVGFSGRRIGLGRTTIRWVLLVVDGPLTVFLCGLITSSSTNGHQRLGDHWSDSYVVGRTAEGNPLTLPE